MRGAIVVALIAGGFVASCGAVLGLDEVPEDGTIADATTEPDATSADGDPSVGADGSVDPFDGGNPFEVDAETKDVVVQDVLVDGAQCKPIGFACANVDECCPGIPPAEVFCFKNVCRSCSNAGGPCDPNKPKTCCPPPPDTIVQFACIDDPSSGQIDPRCCAPSGSKCGAATAKYCCSAKCSSNQCL